MQKSITWLGEAQYCSFCTEIQEAMLQEELDIAISLKAVSLYRKLGFFNVL